MAVLTAIVLQCVSEFGYHHFVYIAAFLLKNNVKLWNNCHQTFLCGMSGTKTSIYNGREFVCMILVERVNLQTFYIHLYRHIIMRADLVPLKGAHHCSRY